MSRVFYIHSVTWVWISLFTPESLHELEDNDLDALMADLVADLEATEEKLAADKQGLKVPSPPPPDLPPPPKGPSTHPAPFLPSPTSPAGSTGSNVSTPASSASSPLPPPPPQSAKPTMVSQSTVCELVEARTFTPLDWEVVQK